MSRKTPLTSQTKKVCIAIRRNVKIPYSALKNYCDNEFDRYAFIEHENTYDVHGELIPVHYHIVGDFKGSKTPLSTRLNTLAKYFGFSDINHIEIEQYRSLEASIQYLTHKNQPEKTPVDKSLIVHNFEPNEFDILYSCDIGSVITFDLLYGAVLSANNIIDIIRELGVKNYKDWRNVIWDIWLTEKGDSNYSK